MASHAKKGLLLLNLGTPDHYDPKSVGVYLKEFLNDPYVIDIPKLLRWILVNILIVPKRKKDSAQLYKKVWTQKGSPLLVHLKDLEQRIKESFAGEVEVQAAMRYGKPPIENAVKAFKENSVSEVLVIPLYPQYSLAATESSIKKTRSVFETVHPEAKLSFVHYFYHEPAYIQATAQVSQKYLEGFSWDKVLFSFHGLPERQVKKTDPTGAHCLVKKDCCNFIEKGQPNELCYRAQSYATARALAEKLGLKEEDYFVGFQSRLKGAPWIRPYSDEFYRELPKKGVKRLAVICPSFVADCLETLEEVQMRGKEEFLENGGEDLLLVPSLNSTPEWAKALSEIARTYQPKT